MCPPARCAGTARDVALTLRIKGQCALLLPPSPRFRPPLNIDNSRALPRRPNNMKISVVIPAYNSAATIRGTLDSVLRQTVAPEEVLIVDDGSSDDTLSLLDSYKERITVFAEGHEGPAGARNLACECARGDVIAFLDSDDIWHPRYLEIQCKAFRKYGDAVCFFTGHVDFRGQEEYRWPGGEADPVYAGSELVSPLHFFQRYNRAAGPFASLSYCCVPRRVLRDLGTAPFEASGAEDTYLFFLLALAGPFVFTPIPLVAYRVSEASLSANRLRVVGALVHAFELLENRYKEIGRGELYDEFRIAFASKRREFAKILMGVGETPEARRQLRCSLWSTGSTISIAKSLSLFLLTYMPAFLQPEWSSRRQVTRLHANGS